MWIGVVGLALVGITAGTVRLLFPDSLMTIGDPHRTRFYDLIGVHDPFTAVRPAEARAFDGRFADHLALIVLHSALGVMLLVLGPLQLSRVIRARWIGLHRWMGRIVLLCTLVVVVTSLPFGLGMPFGGLAEGVIVALVAAFGLAAMGRALLLVRRGDVRRHREWMLRGFAAMIGIATVRVVGAPLDLLLTPLGVSPRALFSLSLWIGWSITLGIAEAWIRRTRPGPPVAASVP